MLNELCCLSIYRPQVKTKQKQKKGYFVRNISVTKIVQSDLQNRLHLMIASRTSTKYIRE